MRAGDRRGKLEAVRNRIPGATVQPTSVQSPGSAPACGAPTPAAHTGGNVGRRASIAQAARCAAASAGATAAAVLAAFAERQVLEPSAARPQRFRARAAPGS